MPQNPSAPGAARMSFAFATCTLIWGSTFLVIRIGNDTVPPMWAAGIRLIVATLVMLALVVVFRRPWPKGRALAAAVWFGLFQFGFNMPLLYWAELVVPSGLAAVVYATIPITAALVARVVGLERLAPLKMLGAAIALGGVMVLFVGERRAGITAIPVLAIYLATVFSSLGSSLLKRGPRQDPLAANAIGAAVGAPVCLLASLLLREHRSLPTQWGQIYPILYLAIVGSVGAFVVFAWLVNHWDISTVAFIGVVVPVIAVALGALVRHEPLHRQNVAGSLLVLAGVGLAIVSDRRALARSPAGH